jgi:hypothetical protein
MKRITLLFLFAACDHALDQRLAIVDAPRVLAVVSEPAEAKPGDTITMSALVASPDGPIAAPPAWALCTAPKPPTEDNAVADGCLGTDVIALGTAPTATAQIPMDACMRFGPDVPPGGFRPRDPDPTGGYYQPVRADAGDAGIAFGFARITCKLGSAPGDVAHDYQTMYVANTNPVLAPLAIDAHVPADSDVTLTAAWNEPELYLYYDPTSQSLITRRESMRVSWFATAGALPVDATAIGEDDPATGATTTWHTPAHAGPVWVWLVLRDSRGGIATQGAAITVDAP